MIEIMVSTQYHTLFEVGLNSINIIGNMIFVIDTIVKIFIPPLISLLMLMASWRSCNNCSLAIRSAFLLVHSLISSKASLYCFVAYTFTFVFRLNVGKGLFPCSIRPL